MKRRSQRMLNRGGKSLIPRRSTRVIAVCASVGVAVLGLAPNASSAVIYGTNGNDSITGTSSADTIYLYAGNDWANGSGGDDLVYGGTGGDTLLGWTGRDRIYGQDNSDEMHGQDGADTIYAGCNPGCATGTDSLYGDESNDTLGAENGKYDYLNGGSGTGDNCYYDNGLDTVQYCEFLH